MKLLDQRTFVYWLYSTFFSMPKISLSFKGIFLILLNYLGQDTWTRTSISLSETLKLYFYQL